MRNLWGNYDDGSMVNAQADARGLQARQGIKTFCAPGAFRDAEPMECTPMPEISTGHHRTITHATCAARQANAGRIGPAGSASKQVAAVMV